MASSSSSSRRKEKVARVTRNANPSVVPHKYMDLQLFKKEGFLFQEWIAYQGLTDFVQMKGDCYPDLVEVFYTNLRVVNGVIHSRVKGVNITVWSNIAGLKAEGLDSHIRDSESNRWLTKRDIYINCLTYPRRYKVDNKYLHDGLNKEEKLIAYVLTWLLLLGRFVEDKMSTEDVLILQRVDVSQEDKLLCNKSQEIGILSLFSIGLEKTVNGWFFRDELTVGSTPTPTATHTAFIPQTDFEKYVVDQFRKKSERDERVEDTLFRWEKKGNKNGISFKTEDSDDESIDED
ncbi:hypothetical protein LR48_Vigan07g133900 [Vigna angularis]|uniref:Uncharacterized protein n=1 Tax=Phaseolus angularis TaxID=3914 RepID=A0A0L9UXQ3_PHAAN|nr:hypothetical protein LR48_Vigan07g133900 [Vigna angularis]